MKLLVLCGYFARENEEEVIRHARRPVEFSANNFQDKLIRGFRSVHPDMQVISAPFIGSYPNASDIAVFRGFRQEQEACVYVPFHNLWGYRNLSRTRALKKAVKGFAAAEDPDKLILVYCTHTPFLEAAAYAKRLDPRIRICLYVPDLPDYMNLRSDRSRLYDIAKKADIARMHRLMEMVDSFVLLTEPMMDMLPVGNKPCLIREGILSGIPAVAEDAAEEKYIVYTGKLDAKFGIPELITGFREIPNGDYRLVLCGRGDCDALVRDAASADPRIMVMGQVTPDLALAWQRRASVLVNPRPNNEEYTKYSFPSKIIEYLLTGKPVVAYLLDGMPEVYRDFLYTVDPGMPAPEALADAILRAMETEPKDRQEKHREFLRYAGEKLSADRIALDILKQGK